MKNQHLLVFLVFLITSFTSAQNRYRSACQGNLARLDSLLQSEPLNAQDNRGRTLLHWAVACRKPQVFNYLIEKGIDLQTKDHEGATPLYMAVRFKSDTLFDALAELHPDTAWKQQQGPKFMERAILDGNLDFVRKLVGYGIDINAVNDRGSSPLEIAKRLKADSIYDWLVANGASIRGIRRFNPSGDWVGQTPPGKTPQVFAPNFISTEEYEFGSVFNAAGDEFYYGVDTGQKSEIRFTQRVHNQWSEPITILSHERYGYNDPFLSPDEQRLYFISRRALDGKGEPKDDYDIWYVERENDSWSEPINAGPQINSEGNEYYISFTKEGTMYFGSNKNAPEERRQSDLDIYYSTYKDGEFQEAVALGDAINTEHYEADVFVAPNESYLIFCSMRPEGKGRGDLYISFKVADDSWTPAVAMLAINTIHHELCPYVSPDGKYLFYTSDQDIYWVDAQVIQDLRPKKGE